MKSIPEQKKGGNMKRSRTKQNKTDNAAVTAVRRRGRRKITRK